MGINQPLASGEHFHLSLARVGCFPSPRPSPLPPFRSSTHPVRARETHLSIPPRPPRALFFFPSRDCAWEVRNANPCFVISRPTRVVSFVCLFGLFLFFITTVSSLAPLPTRGSRAPFSAGERKARIPRGSLTRRRRRACLSIRESARSSPSSSSRQWGSQMPWRLCAHLSSSVRH